MKAKNGETVSSCSLESTGKLCPLMELLRLLKPLEPCGWRLKNLTRNFYKTSSSFFLQLSYHIHENFTFYKDLFNMVFWNKHSKKKNRGLDFNEVSSLSLKKNHDLLKNTLFENYSKCRIWIFEFWHFPPIFVLLKLICLVTLFDRTLHVFKNSPKWTIFDILN